MRIAVSGVVIEGVEYLLGCGVKKGYASNRRFNAIPNREANHRPAFHVVSPQVFTSNIVYGSNTISHFLRCLFNWMEISILIPRNSNQ